MIPQLKLLCIALLVELCMTLPTHLHVASPQAPTGHPVLSSPEDVVWEGTTPEEDEVLEGDLIIGSEIIPLIEFRSGLTVRNLVADPRLLWPDRTVYYQLPARDDDDDDDDSGELAAAVPAALQHIMAVSCVRFSPRPPGQHTYLRLRGTGKGCATKVGYHREEGVLDLHVGGAKCHSRGTIQHEFLHALGFWHEHTRPDRDNYVSVIWDNVKSDYKNNFLKRSEMESLDLGLPYDYTSVMHYKHTSFAKHRKTPTLVPKNKEAVKVMGQRRGVTWVDIAKLNRLYNCSSEYYRGIDLKSDGAVFGKLVEIGIEKQKLKNETLTTNVQDKKTFQSINDSSEEKEVTLNLENRSSLVNFFKLTNIKVNISNDPRLMKQNLKQNPSPVNKNSILESLIKVDSAEKHSHKFKRETNGQPSQLTGNSGMADQPPQNGGHENFAPQKILPELLKGVLNNDNNERPIVIQFAFYQPVIYRNENKTDNADEGSTDTKSKQDSSDKLANRMGSNNNQRDNKNSLRESSREPDKLNRNSQDSNRERENNNRNSQENNREQDKYNRNSPEQNQYNRNSPEQNQYNRNPQDYTRDQDRFSYSSKDYNREQDKYNRNSQQRGENNNRNPQSQFEHEDLALRIPSTDEDYYRRPSYDRPSSSQNQYSSQVRDSLEKGTYLDKQFASTQDYSEIDRRIPYDRRTEYSSSYQVSQKGGGNFKPPSIDHAPPLTHHRAPERTATVVKENFSAQERRIASTLKPEFQESHNVQFKNDEYTGKSNQEYIGPLHPDEPHIDQEVNPKKEFIQPSITPQRRGDDYKSVEKKILPQESYTKTEELVTPITQPKYPVDTDFQVSSLKDDYGQIKHESEVSGVHAPDDQSHSSNPYGTLATVEHGLSDSHDFIPSTHGDFSYDDHHISETKIANVQSKDSFNQPMTNSESTGHFTDTKSGSLHSSDTFVSTNFNANPTKPLREDILSDPKAAKPLTAKTEIPLEVGPPKEVHPLIGSGDGENVAPNWKGVIENVPREEPPPLMSSKESENLNGIPRLSISVSTEIPSGSKIFDRDDIENVETKQRARPVRRPDLVTDQDKIDELDKEIRRQKLEKKLLEEAVTGRPEKVVVTTPPKVKSEFQPSKDIQTSRKVPLASTKVLPPPAFQQSTPTPHQTSKKPSNPRREVQEDDQDVIEADEDLISKPNISRVNLNPRQALPLNANATVKMNLRRLLRKERN